MEITKTERLLQVLTVFLLGISIMSLGILSPGLPGGRFHFVSPPVNLGPNPVTLAPPAPPPTVIQPFMTPIVISLPGLVPAPTTTVERRGLRGTPTSATTTTTTTSPKGRSPSVTTNIDLGPASIKAHVGCHTVVTVRLGERSLIHKHLVVCK